MAVATHNLTAPVLQDIETWTSVQNHDLGYETQDRSTGKRYRYVQHEPGSASITVKSGVPAGAYAGDGGANGVTEANVVTPDASKALETKPIGVYRGSATSANVYGFIELLEPSLPTTVLSSHDNGIVQGDVLVWKNDGFLDSVNAGGAVSSKQLVASVCAIALDSHAADKDQSGDAVTEPTPITVQWL